jgi:hypothetical protein
LLLEVVVEEGGAPKLNPLPAAFGALSSLAAPKPPKGEALPVLSAPPKLPNGLEVEGAGVGFVTLSGTLSAAAPKKFGTLFFGASLAGCAGVLAAEEPKLKPPEGVLPPKGAAAGLLSSADLPKEKVGAGEAEGEALFSALWVAGGPKLDGAGDVRVSLAEGTVNEPLSAGLLAEPKKLGIGPFFGASSAWSTVLAAGAGGLAKKSEGAAAGLLTRSEEGWDAGRGGGAKLKPEAVEAPLDLAAGWKLNPDVGLLGGDLAGVVVAGGAANPPKRPKSDAPGASPFP